MNCVKLTCIDEIDSELAPNKRHLMFDNTPLLTAPNASEQADLIDSNGAVYVNAGPCP